jgi:transcriptional regulator with XRE-family HTH domain
MAQGSPQVLHRTQVLAGRTFKMMREAHGLTQAEFAGLIGVSAGHLSRVEKGTREASVPLQDRIADALADLPPKAKAS